jgi:nitrite reductase/ring-hydroxylating ferredoxin subunit
VTLSATFDTFLRPQELDPERPRPIETPWGTYALFVAQGEVFCVQAFCPHLEGPLFQGTVSKQEVTCPWHLWRFSLATGERVDLPGKLALAKQRLSRCPIVVSERGTLVLLPPRND